MGLAEIRAMKEAAKLPKQVKRYTIPKKSAKKKAQEKAELELSKGASVVGEQENKSDKQVWFDAVRPKLVGICQCGCAGRSQKHDDTFFRHCICHVFPQRIFASVQFHEDNWVERTFWGGHHTNMDEQGFDKWPNMADWDSIKAIYCKLSPLLTDKEKASKFYRLFTELVENN